MKNTLAAVIGGILALSLSAPPLFAGQDEDLKTAPFDSTAFENLPRLKLAPKPTDVLFHQVPGDTCVSYDYKGMSHYVCGEMTLTLAGNGLYLTIAGTRRITMASVTRTAPKLNMTPVQVMPLNVAQKELFLQDPQGFLARHPVDNNGFDPADSPIDAQAKPADFQKRVDADFAGQKGRRCSADGTMCYLDENNDPMPASEIMQLHFEELKDVVVDLLVRNSRRP